MDFSRFLTDQPIEASGRANWQYQFPNGHTASVIVSPYLDEPFRFEVLSSDPGDAGRGGTRRNLTTTERSITMEHSKDVTAVITGNEPPNGTRLILDKGDEWIVIVRDDGEAKSWGQHPDERWFDAAEMGDGPMELHQFLKYAETVYSLGEPLAVFGR